MDATLECEQVSVPPERPERLSLLTGQRRLGATEGTHQLHDDARAALTATLSQRQPVLTDLHLDPESGLVHVGAVAPLLGIPVGQADGESAGADDSGPVGAIILQTDAREYLYPLIQTWPSNSQTAETLLVERSGDDVLFLNDLRHTVGAALSLRVPLARGNLPATMAILGEEGIVRGRDYRGVPVVAELRAIPDSPWFMVAKVDESEALAPWRVRSALIVTVVGLSLLAIVGAAVILWQQTERRHHLAALRASQALHASQERYWMTLMSVGDGVITTDAQGLVEIMNPVAAQLTGWEPKVATARPIGKVLRLVNEYTKEPVASPVDRVMREGVVVGLANHTLLIDRDGAEHPIADSGAPIKAADGTVSGVVLVFRDQSAERAAEQALRESEDRLRRAVQYAPFPIMIHAEDGQVVTINETWTEITGYALDEIPTTAAWTERAYGQRQQLVRADIERLYGLTENIYKGEYVIS